MYQSMCRSSPLRSTLNTNVITGLRMCTKVCTEAVHCVPLGTRSLSRVCMCKVCTEAVHGLALIVGHFESMCRSNVGPAGLWWGHPWGLRGPRSPRRVLLVFEPFSPLWRSTANLKHHEQYHPPWSQLKSLRCE